MQASADGRALEAFIKRRISANEKIGSMLELSRLRGIRASTMYEWFSGARAPRTDSLARIGAVLGVSASQLLDAFEGRPAIEVNDAALTAIEHSVQRGVESAIQQLLNEGVLVRPARTR
jgi:transcriptional regulator with XRE-family HTH domain